MTMRGKPGKKKPLRPIRIEGDIAYVPLTRGMEAIIDAADAPWVGRWNWLAIRSAGGFYAARMIARHGTTNEVIRLHRALLKAPPDRLVDHRNRKTLDNRRANIRLCTHSQNASNQVRRPSKHGYPGVHLWNRGPKYSATVRLDGHTYYDGPFDTAERAHKARVELKKRLHKEFVPEI